ncbi:MAG: MFS transporter [Planctomycetaceae bacterium]|nr:MFS transporter [Planctomycetaceae bacterium]
MSDSPRKPWHTTPPLTDRMPGGIPYIVGNEAAERFSYYGMRAILYLFMTEHLLDAAGKPAHFDATTATEWQHWFGFGVYFLPMAGAILADWLWGKYRTILWLSLMYCLGHAVLALVDLPHLTGIAPKSLLALALVFLSIGAGGIKPCVSAHVGDQFGKLNQHLLPRVYQWFYFAINVGAAASMILTPRLMDAYGPPVAFGVPGVLMAVATVVFWLGRYKFVHVPPTGNRIFSEIVSPAGLRAMANLLPLYMFVILFFAMFEQTQSTWIEQAKSMDRVIHLPVVGEFEFNPAEIQAINSIFVLMLIPLFATVIYPFWGRFTEVTPLKKVGVGLFVTAGSFVVCALVQERIDPWTAPRQAVDFGLSQLPVTAAGLGDELVIANDAPSIWWQVLAYLILTAGEVLVSITVLEFSYTQAPKTLKSFIMGLFLFAIALGNLLIAKVAGMIEDLEQRGVALLSGANYYWTFTVAMLIAAVVFVAWSQFYRGATYIQGVEDPGVEVEAAAEGTATN